MRPLYIPVILGTTRKGRMSAHAARLLTAELKKQSEVTTELIDIAGKYALFLQNCGDHRR